MNLPVKTLGHIDDDRLLALAYSAADVFVAPSVEENLSNSVLESMSCGVPPVVFDTGGMRDAVRHLETGYLAQNRNAEALAQGIDLMLNDLSLRRRCGLNSRRLIEEEFNKPIQAQRFSELYKETVERRRIARQPRSSS
jgi:glycosyltransferase involved in cell wall biosynthesis